MPEKTTTNGTNATGEQIDAILSQIDTAKVKFREGIALLTDLSGTVKQVARDNKVQANDLAKARATLAKLQSMSL